MQYNQQRLLCFNLLFRVQTVVAHTAIVFRIFFAKVVEQQFAAANRRFGVCFGLLQQLSAYVLFGNGLAFHKVFEFLEVVFRVEYNTFAFFSVASRTPCFLVIAFQTLWNIVVDNEPDIGFVDAHAEGNGCNNDVDVFHQEIVLRLRTRFRVETGMVWCCLYVVGLQHGSQFLNLLA